MVFGVLDFAIGVWVSMRALSGSAKVSRGSIRIPKWFCNGFNRALHQGSKTDLFSSLVCRLEAHGSDKRS